MEESNMTMIGIDPGVKTGIAFWDCGRQEFTGILTEDFWQAYELVTMEADRTRVVVYIEDPNGNKPVFGRGQKGRKNLKIAQNVGMNKREASLLIEGLQRLDIAVQPITPRRKKWDAATLKAMTHYKGRTSQHGRDAARMVFGRKAMPERAYNRLLK